jgi:hypothetical protein
MAAKLKKAALTYAARLGWCVFPCVGKVPAIRGGSWLPRRDDERADNHVVLDAVSIGEHRCQLHRQWLRRSRR